MCFLVEHWSNIPNRFADEILGGAATHLAYRFGRLQHDANWVPTEEPNGQVLALLMLDEIERHPIYWHHNRSAAKALSACANVLEDETNASRLLFVLVGFSGCHESRDDIDSETDLIFAGINMIRGEAAQAVLSIAVHFAKGNLPFPELLAPALKRFAMDANPSIRAVILRELPFFQSISPEVGWQVFELATQDGDDRLWAVAETCLYYAYHSRFSDVSRVLARMGATGKGKALETWARISALAALSGHIDHSLLIVQLEALCSKEAWKGATTVWAHNTLTHAQECFDGMRSGLNQADGISASVATEMASLFRDDQAIRHVPPLIVDLYFSALALHQSDDHFRVHGFDDWLLSTSLSEPADTLASAERFASFVQRKQHYYYDHGELSKLMTRLFREAEEREESDSGAMLGRVIALQDQFLSIGVHSLEDWLRDAERP